MESFIQVAVFLILIFVILFTISVYRGFFMLVNHSRDSNIALNLIHLELKQLNSQIESLVSQKQSQDSSQRVDNGK